MAVMPIADREYRIPEEPESLEFRVERGGAPPQVKWAAEFIKKSFLIPALDL